MEKMLLAGLISLGISAAIAPSFFAQDKAESQPNRVTPQLANPSEIIKLTQANKFDEAEKKIDELPPDAQSIKLIMRSMLASALSRAGRNERANAQEEKLILEWKGIFREGKATGEVFAMPLRNLLRARSSKSSPDETANWGREQITELLSLLPKNDEHSSLPAEGALESILAEYRANNNLPEDTEKMDNLIARFREAIRDGMPEERRRYLPTWVNLRMKRIYRKLETSSKEADTDTNILFTEVAKLVDPKEDQGIVPILVDIRTSVARRAMRIDPKVAKSQLDSLADFLDNCLLECDNRHLYLFLENAVNYSERMMQAVEMEIE
jgi:hypothetical protein